MSNSQVSVDYPVFEASTTADASVTADVMRRFNTAFIEHDPSGLADLVGEDCVMDSVQPAPNGTRYVGRAACVEFWEALALDRNTQFTPEEVMVAGDRAVIRWRVRFGGDDVNAVFGDMDANSVSGVNLMLVRDGRIVEAFGYTKTP
ncbi:nuclear transport factor 2 family protein [Embleya sp. NBC_00896]|uniref:nuclear transport factor 2 family protein n=1 Tax=Embleya sp. NBC_00896 TaxID=2975961 RepID=UPI002F91AAAA|nr:nuclear transport factor 2 family protein [Embleya sp. NBC_00896]